MSNMEKLKMAFGFLLLLLLLALACTLALSKVEEETSHGLMPLITAIATLAGAFANWAFGQNHHEEVTKEKHELKTDRGEK